ncbi:MAG TPA: hypothetical protein DF712_23220 [Balneola sp.]|nr:hypothetical protein [Balneola sp.]|tara:strand:- start:150 stop:350 length:201 start_codon:yes stop_codon:yes gene_type:complete
MHLLTIDQVSRIILAWRAKYGQDTVSDGLEQQLYVDAHREILTEDRILSDLNTELALSTPLVKGGI